VTADRVSAPSVLRWRGTSPFLSTLVADVSTHSGLPSLMTASTSVIVPLQRADSSLRR
jgi:hypothetical protein